MLNISSQICTNWGKVELEYIFTSVQPQGKWTSASSQGLGVQSITASFNYALHLALKEMVFDGCVCEWGWISHLKCGQWVGEDRAGGHWERQIKTFLNSSLVRIFNLCNVYLIYLDFFFIANTWKHGAVLQILMLWKIWNSFLGGFLPLNQNNHFWIGVTKENVLQALLVSPRALNHTH